MTQFLDIADEDTDTVAEQLEGSASDRTDYNEIAKYYNTKPVGKIFHFDFPKTKASSLKKQLELRGLLINADVTVAVRPIEEKKDAPTHAFLRRLTDKEAQIITIKVGRRKKDAPVTAEGGEQPAAPAKPPKKGGAIATGAKPATTIGGKKK